MYVIATYRKIRMHQITRNSDEDYTLVSIFFYVFVLLGIFQLIVCATVRFSFTGKVCAGDFVITAEDNKKYEELAEYYMIYEGTFVVIVLIYELISFLLVVLTFYLVN